MKRRKRQIWISRIMAKIWMRITFSRKGKNKEVQELATHLKDIIKFENKYMVENGNPEKSASESKKAFISPILGTVTDQRRQLDAKNFQTSEQLR